LGLFFTRGTAIRINGDKFTVGGNEVEINNFLELNVFLSAAPYLFDQLSSHLNRKAIYCTAGQAFRAVDHHACNYVTGSLLLGVMSKGQHA
jgi:hypothetical protein